MTQLPPQDIHISAVKIGEWFSENNLTDWKIGPCASRETVEKLEKQCDELLSALESIASKCKLDMHSDDGLLGGYAYGIWITANSAIDRAKGSTP